MLLGTACFLLMGGVTQTAQAALVQSFTLVEHFGVNHPDQVVTFDLDEAVTPANCYLLDGEGKEVPWQVLSGGKHGVLALTTDLPAST